MLCNSPDTQGLKATSRCGLQLFFSRGRCHLLLRLKQGYPFYSIQLLHVVTGVHGVLYTRGGKWNPRRSRGCHFPSRVYKTHGPQSQRATIVLLYLCIIVNIPLLEVLLSSSNIITANYSLFNKQTNEKQLPRTRGCFVHSAKSTNAGNDQGDVHPVYITFHVTRRVASHLTCVFVVRHMIGSRPIKLHSLHRGITSMHDICL